WLALGLAAAAKAVFLAVAAGLVAALLLPLQPALLQVFGWPQFLTALAGGVVAFGLLHRAGPHK
ncbi:MAG TPA: hypothetical protein VLC52_14800, partial [Anaerolineae bacterium]|nr:hypothetical protein [Anaerolineae bacterium]